MVLSFFIFYSGRMRCKKRHMPCKRKDIRYLAVLFFGHLKYFVEVHVWRQACVIANLKGILH